MKIRAICKEIPVFGVLLLTGMLTGCGRGNVPEVNAMPVLPAAAVSTAAPVELSEAEDDALTLNDLSPDGIWQTGSMGYEYYGTVQPEYYVRFTDSEIQYGHMKEGQFVTDHSVNIVSIEETAAGGIRIKAEATGGLCYIYQTGESDSSVLEYYETWKEEDFPEMYRGGASLSRCG